MNHCLPDWNFETDLPVFNHKKPIGPDHEVAELLWRNGQVVLHSQTNRKPSTNINESGKVEEHNLKTSRSTEVYGNSSGLTHDDQTVSWIQYPLEDSFDKEFCSNFFSDLPASDPIVVDKLTKQFEEDKSCKFDDSVVAHVSSLQPPNIRPSVAPEILRNTMPPPRFQFPDSSPKAPNMGSSNGQLGGKGYANARQGDVGECSAMTVGSSHSGSNQLLNESDFGRVSSSGVDTNGLSMGKVNHDFRKIISQRGQTETFDQTGTSSSGGSGSSFGRTCKQSTDVADHKRKDREVESEHQSEDAEQESVPRTKPSKRPGSSRKSRAAEVHNLSERRRRDRINEKMKTLQELIPHSNKTDKASMLDEAIEYLKSLQLQIQMMWTGGGISPLMFPGGVQQYMSRMSMGMGPPPLPSLKHPLQFPIVPINDQSISVAPTQSQPLMYQTPVLNPVNYQNQMQNPGFTEQYARYMGFHHMQTASQQMNMLRFGSQTLQQSPATAAAGSSNESLNGGSATNDALDGKLS